jgi:hypothetical protein
VNRRIKTVSSHAEGIPAGAASTRTLDCAQGRGVETGRSDPSDHGPALGLTGRVKDARPA